MKQITVVNEKWFSTAPIEDVVALGLRVLDVPALSLDNKDEKGQRTLIRQVFKTREEYDFGQTFDIPEMETNPFKKPIAGPVNRPRVAIAELTGPYKVVKCRLRAQENDRRWELWGLMARHKTFEELFAQYDSLFGSKTKFGSTGKATFTPREFAQWALKCGWIVRS